MMWLKQCSLIARYHVSQPANMLSRILTLALLVATAVTSPVAQALSEEPSTTPLPTSTIATSTSSTKTSSTRTRPTSTRTCVLSEDPKIVIEQFTRPNCVCDCYKQACQSVNRGGSHEDYLACLNRHFGPNPVDFGTEMIAAYGGCVGGTRCIG
ncbi:hypothetical protein B0T16DRAFT_209800 [Cercophora newfieldiana]|uniref:Uncharacterized protein n=1 Tax=Cercophora newfieldiana TaxID=92897 RepID=A0AA39XW14_9PEZI|nr:hypothetical protein B0T16DRAFT_209800 [Cercophora newfieldiana]